MKTKKNNLIKDEDDNVDRHNHFMEQAFSEPYPSMKHKCTTTKEIERIINSLKTKLIRIRDIHKYPKNNSPINYICNKMLFWGVFPDRLKYSIIKPIHKNYDTCEVSNYRPISLLTPFSKILETVKQRRTLKQLTIYFCICVR